MTVEKYEIISKHFASETNHTEDQAVLEWRAKDSSQDQEYQYLLKLWDETLKSPVAEPIFDEQLAMQKVLRRLDEANQNVKPFATKPRVMSLFRVARWAAAAVVIMGVGFWGYQQFIFNPIITFKNEAMVVAKNVTLPDGSVVKLEPGASISYPKYFRDPLREINFKGEGFFKVSHNAEKPFVVDVKDAEVKVLGTSFDVIESSEGVEVAVATGNVRLGNKKNPTISIMLKAGQRAKMKGDKVEEILSVPVPEPIPAPPPPPPKPKEKTKKFDKAIYIWDGSLYKEGSEEWKKQQEENKNQ